MVSLVVIAASTATGRPCLRLRNNSGFDVIFFFGRWWFWYTLGCWMGARSSKGSDAKRGAPQRPIYCSNAFIEQRNCHILGPTKSVGNARPIFLLSIRRDSVGAWADMAAYIKVITSFAAQNAQALRARYKEHGGIGVVLQRNRLESAGSRLRQTRWESTSRWMAVSQQRRRRREDSEHSTGAARLPKMV